MRDVHTRLHSPNLDDAPDNDLLNAVDERDLPMLASLQFGFIELDCALIHGSSADIGDRLTRDTSPLILLDHLTRLDVNRLFTARSGQQFRLDLTGGAIRSHVKDKAGEQQQEQTVPKRSLIGIGQGAALLAVRPRHGSTRLHDGRRISRDATPTTSRLWASKVETLSESCADADPRSFQFPVS